MFIKKKYTGEKQKSNTNKLSFVNEEKQVMQFLHSAVTWHMIGNEKMLLEKEIFSHVIRTSKIGIWRLK